MLRVKIIYLLIATVVLAFAITVASGSITPDGNDATRCKTGDGSGAIYSPFLCI